MKEICIKLSQPVFFSKFDKEFFLDWLKNNYPNNTFASDKEFFTVTVMYKLKLRNNDVFRLCTLLNRYRLTVKNRNDLQNAMFKRDQDFLTEVEDDIRTGKQYVSKL
jgi:hypothetical protein